MINKRIVLGAMLALASTFAQSATWTVGTATATPGQTVSIPLVIWGDGATQGAEIVLTYDEVRLSLPVASGTIPGADVSGQCARTTSKSVAGIVLSVGSVLPSGPTTVCNVPFTVKNTARVGRIALNASAKE